MVFRSLQHLPSVISRQPVPRRSPCYPTKCHMVVPPSWVPYHTWVRVRGVGVHTLWAYMSNLPFSTSRHSLGRETRPRTYGWSRFIYNSHSQGLSWKKWSPTTSSTYSLPLFFLWFSVSEGTPSEGFETVLVPLLYMTPFPSFSLGSDNVQRTVYRRCWNVG